MEGCVVRLHSVSFNRSVPSVDSGPGDSGPGDFSAQPIRVYFHQLLRTNDAPALLPEVSNEDVLCAVVALLDASLPGIDSQDIHETVLCPGIHTIVLLRDHAEVLEEYRVSLGPHPDSQEEPVSLVPPDAAPDGSDSGVQFSKVYSESEDSSEESSLSEDTDHRWSWECFCADLQQFMNGVQERREMRDRARQDGYILPSAVGVESLLVAAATYEIKTLSVGEEVLQISLLATRRRYRRCGVGRYIIELLKTQSVCGKYDALLAHVDTDAEEFFKRCGLTDDPLLNSKFKEVRDEWTNTTLMSYLPPFTTELESRNPGFSLSLEELDAEVNLARTRALSAYQQQAVCVSRLVREVKTLREQLKLQREEVNMLNYELEREKERRHITEQMFLEYKLRKSWQVLEQQTVDSDDEVQEDSKPASPAETEPDMK